LTIKAFVIGHPIAHSRSPIIHGTWLAEHGIDGSYSAIDVAPAELPAFFDRLRSGEFAGGNVTIPHKEAVFALCDSVDPLARTIGAVNTLVVTNGKVHGTNTDYLGFLGNLDAGAPFWSDGLENAVVLGAGGAARAVLVALQSRNVGTIHLFNRTLANAVRLASEIGGNIIPHEFSAFADVAPTARLVVNTSSDRHAWHPLRQSRISACYVPTARWSPTSSTRRWITPLLADASGRWDLRTWSMGWACCCTRPCRASRPGSVIRPAVTPALRARIEATLGALSMWRIGITGSIATGKSTVLRRLQGRSGRTGPVRRRRRRRTLCRRGRRRRSRRCSPA
jgi:shikimate dehydrogenase